MYEYGVKNTITGKKDIIFGYTFANACTRAKLNGAELEIEYQEYID